MRLAAIYGNGAVLGFSPQQVNEMSMWQFMAALDGYVTAHSADDGKSLTKDEEDDLWEMIVEAS